MTKEAKSLKAHSPPWKQDFLVPVFISHLFSEKSPIKKLNLISARTVLKLQFPHDNTLCYRTVFVIIKVYCTTTKKSYFSYKQISPV